MIDKESAQNGKQDGENQPIELPDNPEEFEFDSASVKPRQIFISDEELKELQRELLEYKDKYLRLLADGENVRKRMQKERQEIIRHATESLIIDFLSPIDNFENALRFAQDMSEEVRNWAFGFQMILAQFKDILAQNGVTPFEAIGKPFNPHDHEAIEMEETIKEPPGTVIRVNLKGYKMGDRTIRATRVTVAKSFEKEISSQE